MRTIDPGHIYDLSQQGTHEKQRLTFLKRSTGCVTHPNEHPGVLTQEVIRCLIDRSVYLNDLLPCEETQRAIEALQEALYWYEARAYRRKEDGVNKLEHHHGIRVSRADIPFSALNIEKLPTGDDGHIITP
jgi:hypothetical protein